MTTQKESVEVECEEGGSFQQISTSKDSKKTMLQSSTKSHSSSLDWWDRATFPLLMILDASLFGVFLLFALVFGIGCDREGKTWRSCSHVDSVGGVVPAVLIVIAVWFVVPCLAVPLASWTCRRRQRFHYDVSTLGSYTGAVGQQEVGRTANHLPIVYTPSYNITFCGLENVHPFDSKKYKKVFERIEVEATFKPHLLKFSDLSSIHSASYLTSLFYSLLVVKILEVPLCFLPAWLLQWRVLIPKQFATNGTMAAARLSLDKGWSINLGGGFHHASYSKGHGFCAFADISLAAKYVNSVWEAHQLSQSDSASPEIPRILIIDLDAHQGDGHALDAAFYGWDNVFIFDYFTPGIFPGDRFAAQRINRKASFSPMDTGAGFIRNLKNILPQVFQQFRPDFVLYNAGTDILDGDPLSGLSISAAAIVQRDLCVFAACMEPTAGSPELYEIFEACGKRHVPITMVLSGGYQQNNAGVIAECIENMRRTFKLY